MSCSLEISPDFHNGSNLLMADEMVMNINEGE